MAGGARAVRLVELEARNGIDAKALQAAVTGAGAKYWHPTFVGEGRLVCYGLVSSNRCMLLQSTH